MLKKLLVLAAIVAAFAGCGGGGSGGSNGLLSLFVTDAMDGNDAVWVTIHRIELLTASGSETVFSSDAGVTVDVRSLHDASGHRFEFMGDDKVPGGTYTGVRVTMEKSLVVFAAGATTGTPMQFADAFNDANGKTVVSYNFAAPMVLSAGDDDLVIDFDLADWNEASGIVTPVLKAGSEDGLQDETRHEDGSYDGKVSGLLGTAPDQTFTLSTHDHGTFNVKTDSNTEFDGEDGLAAALANGSFVEVEGTYDTATNTLLAKKVSVEDGDQEPQKAEGSVTAFDAGAGTITITLHESEGFAPLSQTLTLDANAAGAKFYGPDETSKTKAEFFALLSAGVQVKAKGTFDSGTNTLTGASFEIDD